jgi:hypothetical protein
MDDEIWNVLEGFDWDRVHFAMTQLNWRWLDEELSPTISELRTEARKLLKLCVQGSIESNNCFTISCGGFEAHADVDGDVCNLSLKFVLCESNNF